jgi:hypothetical protein
MQLFRNMTFVVPLIAALGGAAVSAQETSAPKGIDLELNAADLVGESCRVTFVIINKSEVAVDKAIYETVLFSDDGQVLMLTLFDFGALPFEVPRVRQFQVADTSCSRIGMVLINGANRCIVAGKDVPVCGQNLRTSSRLSIKLQG